MGPRTAIMARKDEGLEDHRCAAGEEGRACVCVCERERDGEREREMG